MMNIETLKSLGIAPEELGERIVDQAVDRLLNTLGFDPESNEEIQYVSKFQRQIQERLQKAVDEKIAAIAAEHLIPRVGELIEKANMTQTTKFGEPKGAPMTFMEYIAHRAEVYMSENVDHKGESKQETNNEYGWRAEGPRLVVFMKMYIRDTMEKQAKEAVSDVNKVIAQNIQKAAMQAIAAAANSLKVEVKV